MKIRTRWIFTIILCLLIAISLAACNGSPENKGGTLESQSGVSVEGKFGEGASLKAVEVVGADKQTALDTIADEKYDKDGKIYVYDISVIKDGVKIQPDGKVKVTVSVPEIDTGKTYTVYHIKQDGAVEKIKPTVQSGKVVFETDGFSCFIIAPDDTSSVGGDNEPTKKQVNVSINILPLAAYGTLKVNDVLYNGAASYKTKHTEGDKIKVEAVAASGHHFDYWGEDKVLSRESVYEFTVGTKDISFAANFTAGHVVEYSDITAYTHTEKCKYCDHTATVEHTFLGEEITQESTCQHGGEIKSVCACGKIHTETTPATDHVYIDGVCKWCSKQQLYVRVNANGVANPQGAYIKMGKTYCEQVRDGELENALMEIAGSPYLTNYENWTPFDFGNGDSGENATTYYCDVEYNGLHYRGVNIKESRKDNDNTQTTSSRYWTGTYWFEQREAMWQIVNEKDGKAYLVSKEIWISQRFAESETGELTYENSWIRAWLKNTWINELFTPAQQAILQGNEACFGDKIFLPSSDEISINNPKPFGLYKYPFCLGAYKEVLQGYGDNYCPYWLRDGVEKGTDGKNYVTCVTSKPPFDQTTKYLATKTFVGVVPAIIIEL